MDNKNFSGRKLYLILWGGTAIIISGMFMLNRWQLNAGSINDSRFILRRKYHPDEEMNISSKNSFINLLLRSEYTEEIPVQQDYMPKSSFKNGSLIFRRSVQNRPDEDFSIGPVPK